MVEWQKINNAVVEALRDVPASHQQCQQHQRSDSEKKLLLNRLKRIEGQIRGIYGMVENDAYCIDILNQALAANAALTAFDKALLSNHIKTCVVDDIKNGDDEVVDELIMTMQKFMK